MLLLPLLLLLLLLLLLAVWLLLLILSTGKKASIMEASRSPTPYQPRFLLSKIMKEKLKKAEKVDFVGGLYNL